MSADRIKLKFDGVYLGPRQTGGTACQSAKPSSGPGGAWLKQVSERLPFFDAFDTHQDRGYSTPLWSVGFGSGEIRLLTALVAESPYGGLRLHKVDANLPSLLRGHNGALLLNADEYHLALTRVHWLLAPLLDENGSRRLLRLNEVGGCCWNINYIEATAQFEDPGRQVILDSHLSQLKGFHQKPLLVPGETTALRSNELDLKIYAKDLEVSRKLKVSCNSAVTRIEAQYKTTRAMVQALGAERRSVVHAIPFGCLIDMFNASVGDRIVGGVASPKAGPPDKVKGSTKRVLDKAPSPANMHAALHQECSALTSSNGSKLRSRVFSYFADSSPSDLPALLAEFAQGKSMAQLHHTSLEEAYKDQCVALGAPVAPDPAIVEAFSSLRTTQPIRR